MTRSTDHLLEKFSAYPVRALLALGGVTGLGAYGLGSTAFSNDQVTSAAHEQRAAARDIFERANRDQREHDSRLTPDRFLASGEAGRLDGLDRERFQLRPSAENPFRLSPRGPSRPNYSE